MHVLVGVLSTTPSNSDEFTALVTVEGLLFAAISISATLSSVGDWPVKSWGPRWLLPGLSAALLVLVAIATVFSWGGLFAGHDWQPGTDKAVQAMGLLVAIVAQPVIAVIIAVGIVRD